MRDAPADVPALTQRHPVAFEVAYPDQLSRLTTFFRLVLAIPHMILVYLLLSVLGILSLVAWFAILFTGSYPRSMFDFSVGILRWSSNLGAYVGLLRDEYPPFSFDAGTYPATLDVPYAEKQSRLRLFVRFFAIIPNQIVLWFVQFAYFITTFVAWWAILFTGRYPRGLHAFAVGVQRWGHRQAAYLYLLRDEYPPYSTSADAKPGNEVVSAIIGFPILVGYAGLYIAYLSIFFQGGTTVAASLAPGAIEQDQPSAHTRSLEITLTGFDQGPSAVAFDVEARQRGRLPAVFAPVFFTLETCDGLSHPVESTEGDAFNWYWMDGEDQATVRFDVPGNAPICDLLYFTGTGFMRFEFD